MSRRHKENDIKYNCKPQQMESHDVVHLGDKSDNNTTDKKLLGGLTIAKCVGTATKFLADKILNSLICISIHEIVIDDKWVKIPRSAFDELDGGWLQRFRELSKSQFVEEQVVNKRGRNPIKRLINKISDSKVMEYFHDTLSEVKKKCIELYENVTQFSVCFLKGIHNAFCPDDDPYGKISHYHEMIKGEVWDFPSRKTLSNYYNWFINWRPVLYNESKSERKLRHKHSLWRQLIEWIYYYLLQKAPEYAFQTQKG